MNNTARRVFMLIAFSSYSAQGQQQSQTFLSLRPPFQSGSPERESLMRKMHYDCLSFVQVVPFWGHSTNAEDIAEFFLPSGKSTLVVAENLAQGHKMRDLNAKHFNIETVNSKFKSNLLFRASHQFTGIGLAYRQQIARKWWFETSAPFVRVETRFGFDENIIDDGGGPVNKLGLDDSPRVGCMLESFRQENWRFGKIDRNLKLVKEGFADLEFKVGYQARADEALRLYGYGGFVFPTGNRPTAQFIFEPMVGNNGHFGVLYGSHIGLSPWCKGEHQLSFALDFQTRYLFRNDQLRSFDLKDKEFSRYIESYDSPEQAVAAAAAQNSDLGTSGINVFTQRVKVFPGLSLSFLSALVYMYKQLEIEAGYYFFARQAEKIEINWRKVAAVKDAEGKGQTNTARTMREDFKSAAIPLNDYRPLAGRDLNGNSAASPAFLSYTAYLAIGYKVCDGDHPVLLGIGASYEAAVNRGLNQWATWGKLVIRF